MNLIGIISILGACCTTLAFLPKSYKLTITCFFLLGKCFSGAMFLLVWLITAELYPTNLRSQAVGTCSTISRVFGLVAPFVGRLAFYWKPLPMLILGIPCFIASLLVYSLPETKQAELPATMKDADAIQKLKTNHKPMILRPTHSSYD